MATSLAPASNSAVGFNATSVGISGANRQELGVGIDIRIRRTVYISLSRRAASPTCHGAIRPDATAVEVSNTDLRLRGWLSQGLPGIYVGDGEAQQFFCAQRIAFF